MNADLGPQRLTGDSNHVRFVDWLAARFLELGCSIQRDAYTDGCTIAEESGPLGLRVLANVSMA